MNVTLLELAVAVMTERGPRIRCVKFSEPIVLELADCVDPVSTAPKMPMREMPLGCAISVCPEAVGDPEMPQSERVPVELKNALLLAWSLVCVMLDREACGEPE